MEDYNKMKISELREVARSRGLKGWTSLRKSALKDFLFNRIQTLPPPLKPTPYQPPKPTPKPIKTLTWDDWDEWLTKDATKPIKKKISDAHRIFKNKVLSLYDKEPSLKPKLISEAIRKNTSKWIIPGEGFKDPIVFLEFTTIHVRELINNTDSVGKKVYTILKCKMIRSDPKTGEDVITIANFRSKTHSIITEGDSTTEYEIMKLKMLESLAVYQKLGSGWRLLAVDGLEIFITKYKPLKGNSYQPLPDVIVKKKAIINIKNDDDQCFKWAVTRALNPVERDGENVTKILKKQAENYNWDGLEFPMKVKDIYKFEKVNDINVNVFSYDDEKKNIYTLRLSKMDNNESVNLFLFNNHYSVVKNLSRLLSNQISTKGHERNGSKKKKNEKNNVLRVKKRNV